MELQDSLQTMELKAILWAFSAWRNEPLNVVTDSLYAAGICQRIEDAHIRDNKNVCLISLFLRLKHTLRRRKEPYCVIHIRSHLNTVGLGQGNAVC